MLILDEATYLYIYIYIILYYRTHKTNEVVKIYDNKEHDWFVFVPKK